MMTLANELKGARLWSLVRRLVFAARSLFSLVFCFCLAVFASDFGFDRFMLLLGSTP